ncbi:chondroitin AC/alginate lyase [Auriculariales sp. MPI-PUGE-AT-0066]|nr:chondroitin AC/alginate lyase [Auriculariales sp. MPI-PUGE-AT-0066]
MPLFKSALIPFLALAGSAAAAALDWSTFISYDNEFVAPEFLLGKPWEKDNTTLDAAQSVVSWANTVSQQGPWSVTQKPFTASTGDKHDYLSWAPYWWPDCSKVGNTTELTPEEIWKTCPYVGRDGQFVPDVRQINDTGSYAALCDAVFYTSIAWVITDDEKYANRAIEYIRTWFLNDDTYMNPNLVYSQVIRGPPGTQEGRHEGVLDLKTTSKILTGILLFRETKYSGWTQQDDDGMVDWSKKMANWLATHHFGKDEMAAPNNHGSYSFNTMAAFQLIARQPDEAKRYLQIYFDGIYQNQIDDKGEQPFEAHRTRLYHYRAYGAGANIINNKLAAYVGYDGWSRPTKAGTNLQNAVTYAMQFDPAATDEVTSAPAEELYQHVAAVAAHYGDPDGKYAAYLARVDPKYPQSPYFLWNQPLALPANYKSRARLRASRLVQIAAASSFSALTSLPLLGAALALARLF